MSKRESGFLFVLTPDDNGVLNTWSEKYVVIQTNQDRSDSIGSKSSLLIFNHPNDDDVEIEIPLEGSQIDSLDASENQAEFVFAITTKDSLRLYLKASSLEDMSDWISSLRDALPFEFLERQMMYENGNDTFMHDGHSAMNQLSSSNVFNPGNLSASIERDMSMIPHSSVGYLLFHDNFEGWKEVFGVIGPGKLLLFQRACDKASLVGAYSLVGADFYILTNAPKEQIEINLQNQEQIHLMGNNSMETYQWLETIKRRAVEEEAKIGASIFGSNIEDIALDAYTFLRRTTLSAASQFYNLDYANQRESDADALAFIPIGSLYQSEAGLPARFEIHCAAADLEQYGFHRIDATDFDIFLSSENDFDGSFERVVNSSAIADDSTGAFVSQVLHTVSGNYRLHVCLGRSPVYGSPFPFQITPSAPSAAHCSISGLGTSQVYIDRVVSFKVSIRDRYLNPAFVPRTNTAIDDTLAFKVEINGPAVLERIERNDTAKDGTTYEIFYRATKEIEQIHASSSIRIDILLNSVPIAGSPLIPGTSQGSNLPANNLFQNSRGSGLNGNTTQTMTLYPAGAEPTERVFARAVDTAIEAQDAARAAIEAAKAVLKKSERAAMTLSKSYKDELIRGNDVSLDEGKLSLLMGSAGVKTSLLISDKFSTPSSLTMIQQSDNGKILWRKEIPPPPWASINEIEAYVRRQRLMLNESLAPLRDIIIEECANSKLHQPSSLWKRNVMSWPGPDAPRSQLSELRVTFLDSPIEHKQIIVDMIENILEYENRLVNERKKQGLTQTSTETESKTEPEPSQLSEREKAIATLRNRMKMMTGVERIGEFFYEGVGSSISQQYESDGSSPKQAIDSPISQQQDPQSSQGQPIFNPPQSANQTFSEAATNQNKNPSKELSFQDKTQNHNDLPEIPSTSDIVQPRLGARVTLGDDRGEGIVKFFGPVQFAKGNWVGIELDSPNGRNDGAVMGVRYFECEKNIGKSEKQLFGLFTRPERVTVVDPFPRVTQQSFNDFSTQYDSHQDLSDEHIQEQIPELNHSNVIEATIKADVGAPKRSANQQDNLENSRANDSQLDIENIPIAPPKVSTPSIPPKREPPTKPLSVKQSNGRDSPSVQSASKPNPVNITSTSVSKQLEASKMQSNARQLDNQEPYIIHSNANTPQRRSDLSQSAVSSSNKVRGIARSGKYPNTPEWIEVENWLDLNGISRSYERTPVLDAFLASNINNLQKVARINGDIVNKMPLGFDLRMRLLSKSKELAKSLMFQSRSQSKASGLSPSREALLLSSSFGDASFHQINDSS